MSGIITMLNAPIVAQGSWPAAPDITRTRMVIGTDRILRLVDQNGNATQTGGTTTNLKKDSFAFVGAGPYNLTQTPNGNFYMLLGDGFLQWNDPFTVNITAKTLTLVGVTDLQNVTFLYSY